MGTEIFGFGQWWAEIIGFKEDGGPESLSGPRESFKVGYVSLNSILVAIFCDNQKVSVYIGKLMTGGFQNTPTTLEYHCKLKVLELYKTKPNFMKKKLWIKLHENWQKFKCAKLQKVQNL